jgi:DNA-binding HxlR family transcriptional regulator
MTPLQALILKELFQRGPMRDVELWQHTTEVNLTPVTLECLALQHQGYIEIPRGYRPVSSEWQLTEKGRAYVATQSTLTQVGSSMNSRSSQ